MSRAVDIRPPPLRVRPPFRQQLGHFACATLFLVTFRLSSGLATSYPWQDNERGVEIKLVSSEIEK